MPSTIRGDGGGGVVGAISNLRTIKGVIYLLWFFGWHIVSTYGIFCYGTPNWYNAYANGMVLPIGMAPLTTRIVLSTSMALIVIL